MSRLNRRLRNLCSFAALLTVLSFPLAANVAAAANPSLGRWEKLRSDDLRVAGVAYRLSLANAQLCANAVAPLRGFVLHSIDQYDSADRQEAARSFALGSHVAVMAVVSSGPAQRSGLQADDQLVSVNGRSLSVAKAVSNTGSTNEAVAFAQGILAEEMAKGEVKLRISRGAQIHEARFAADIGCASDVELLPGAGVNAWADGKRVVVSDGLIAHCRTDNDLALVIAHELAHNLLRHSERLSAVSSGHRRLQMRTSSAEQETEEEADRLGVRMATAAAYDLSGALPFVTALLGADDEGTIGGTHPTSARRLALLRAEIATAGR
jgi:Zn-dependent protease with chaperone function